MRSIIFRSAYIVGVVLFFFAARLGMAQPFDGIIAFGDSLTDVGNVALLTIPGNSPVINGYYKETHFSDNIIWVERVAEFFDLPDPTPGRGNSTTLPPEVNGTIWAWGGSEAASGTVQPPGVTEPIPNLLTEVQEYLASNVPNRRTLYAIWSGADNLLIGGKFGPKAARQAVKTVTTAMQLLASAGARHFILFNMPKLGDTPSAQAGGIFDEAAADLYSDSYNSSLRHALRRLRRDPTFDAKIYFVDIYSELVRVVNTVNNGDVYTPRFFVPGPPVEISNVTDQALDVFNSTGTFPTNYLFWDDVHPTTQGHQVVAGLVLRSLWRGLFGR